MIKEKVLNWAKGESEEAEVFSKKSQTDLVLFEANRLKSLLSSSTQELALRVIKNGRLGLAYFHGQRAEIEKDLKSALEVSYSGPKARFSFPPKYPPSPVTVWDENIERITTERIVELGEEIISQLRELSPGLVCRAFLIKRREEVSLINSSGAQVDYWRSYFFLEVEGVLVRDTDMLFVGDLYISCSPLTDIKPIVERITRQIKLAERKAKVATKKLPVIFTPRGVLSSLLTPLSLAFNGKLIVQKSSPLTDKLGERVFSPKLNIKDDATLSYAYPSLPWDDEGIHGESTVLVKEGVVSNFLYDLQTAGILKVSSNGKARRRSGIPSPDISTLVIKPGSDRIEDMIQGIKEGLLVEQLIGAEMGNVLGGEFSGNVLLGFKIENGEIVGRVKDTMVSGNIYEALREIIGLGNKGRLVGNLSSPHICLHLPVASKGL